jgi:hypothetical protein
MTITNNRDSTVIIRVTDSIMPNYAFLKYNCSGASVIPEMVGSKTYIYPGTQKNFLFDIYCYREEIDCAEGCTVTYTIPIQYEVGKDTFDLVHIKKVNGKFQVVH